MKHFHYKFYICVRSCILFIGNIIYQINVCIVSITPVPLLISYLQIRIIIKNASLYIMLPCYESCSNAGVINITSCNNKCKVQDNKHRCIRYKETNTSISNIYSPLFAFQCSSCCNQDYSNVLVYIYSKLLLLTHIVFLSQSQGHN